MSGPISVSSSVGSPTTTPATAGSRSAMKRRRPSARTRIRERAQQSCPALSKTPEGARAAASSTSASAKTMLALLPPSSRVTRFTCCGAAGHDGPPDLGRAGEAHLAHGGVGDEALAHHAALARQDLQDPLGQPGLEGQLPEAQRAERGQLGRLEHHRVAGGQGRGEAPAGDGHGEVPGHDHAHHAERLVERDVDAAGDRDLPTALALGRGGVVLDHVAHVAGLPAGVADHVAGVGHLEGGQLVEVGVHGGGEAAQQAGPVPRRHGAPVLEGGRRPGDGRVDLARRQALDV